MMNISGKINQGLDLKGTTGPLHLYPFTRRSNQSILKEVKSWVFIGRTDAEAETPILWLPDAKN